MVLIGRPSANTVLPGSLAALTAPNMSLALLAGWIAELAVTVAPFQRSVALMVRADAGDQIESARVIENKIAGTNCRKRSS